MRPSIEGDGSARPSPLTVYRNSYLIRKAHSPPPPGWSSSSNSAASSGNINSHHHHQGQQARRPVIIYTQSPKVIHAEPHDFMALVQKLTGMSRSSDDNTSGTSARPLPPAQLRPRGGARSDCDSVKAVTAGSDDSWTTSETSGDEDAHGVQLSATTPAMASPAVLYHPSTYLFLPDAPIFTPTARYCCPSHSYYRSCSDVGFSPSEVSSSMIFSPSVAEIMRTSSDHAWKSQLN